MAYTPNPDREIVNGKAKVSAKELADFQKQYGNDKTLRDLLNMDKGLVRRKDPEDIQSSTDAKPSMSRQSGPPTTTQGATYPKPSIEEGGVKPKSRSSWDSTFGEDAEAGFKRAARGDSPLGDALMGAGQLAIAAMPVGKALRAARPLVGAVAQSFRESLKDLKEGVPAQRFSAERDVDIPFEQAVNKVGAAQMARELKENTGVKDLPNTNPDKKYGQGEGFLGRTKDEFLNRKKGGSVKQYAKGGKISLAACGVSTHKPAKKNPNF
jgi:hypothetical protein